MNKLVFAVIAVVIIALAGGVYLSKENENVANNTEQVTDTTELSEANETEDEQETKAEEVELPAAGAQGILEYSPEALAASETEDNIVFFHARWCTICTSVERNIQAGNIPDTLSIFKIDYDSDEGRALAEEYGIGPQYTMVQVNRDGSEITQWVNQYNFGISDIVNNLI